MVKVLAGTSKHVRRRWRKPFWRTVLVASLVGLIPTLGLAAFSLTKSADESVFVEEASYEAQVDFQYVAIAERPSLVYPEGMVGPVDATSTRNGSELEESVDPFVLDEEEDTLSESGEEPSEAVVPPQPLYRALIREVELRIDHQLEFAPDPEEIKGSFSADLVVATADGWTNVATLIDSAPVDGGESSFTVVADLREAEELIRAASELTETSTTSYRVEILPRFEMSASSADEQLEYVADPVFSLEVNGARISPSGQLQFSYSDEIGTESVVQSTLSLGDWSFQVRTVRIAMGSLAAVFLMLFLFALRQTMRRDTARLAWFRLLYGNRVIEVEEASGPIYEMTFYVSSLKQLARLSKQRGQSIIHVKSRGKDLYYIVDGHARYLYEIPEDARGVRQPAQIHMGGREAS